MHSGARHDIVALLRGPAFASAPSTSSEQLKLHGEFNLRVGLCWYGGAEALHRLLPRYHLLRNKQEADAVVRIVEACTLRFSFLRREEPHKSRESLVSLLLPACTHCAGF
jgi:hypothetical protein